GVTATTVARLEQGRTHQISTRSLERMSRVLGVSADYLLGISDRREGGLSVEPGDREDLIETPLHVTAVESYGLTQLTR
ncbi:MAG TPA: helix-turn-helix transcriptional regulator, partial [Ktedonobacteraceae bacterium]|nr:helix-turn-helix transcriptional regulator [Ktedonobacteraceae bacterium]